MKKEEFIRRYGEVAYKKWCDRAPKTKEEFVRRYGEVAYEKHAEYCCEHVKVYKRKGGPGHEKANEATIKYRKHPIPKRKGVIRGYHFRRYQKYKNIIAPGSEIHHEWISGTADYRGVALVEADTHRQGMIDVIQILEGKITLFNGV